MIRAHKVPTQISFRGFGILLSTFGNHSTLRVEDDKRQDVTAKFFTKRHATAEDLFEVMKAIAALPEKASETAESFW
jgi:hypothetical protein